MKEVSINEGIRLSEHFTLGELTKTSYHTLDGNIPPRVAIENLRNLCEGWLEDLRYSYNRLYGGIEDGGRRKEEGENSVPVIISSGYRSKEVNMRCGGSPSSNHLTGCAVDIRCMGPEQQIRYAGILLDIADGTRRDFDELILEKRGTTYWIHFAVRPPLTPPVGGGGNRRRIRFDMR